MAEESMKNKSGGGKFITSLGKGLNTDVSPETQPEGTYRWALNAVSESEEGNIGFLTNEEGNYTCDSLDPEWVIIGHVYVGNDEAVIFQAPKDSSVTAPNYGQGRISRIKSDCSIVNVLTAGCLNFKLVHQIQATYRIRKGCEISIYYTDDFNKVGYINIDALDDYLAEGQEQYIANNPDTYMNDAYDSSGDPIWDCDKLSLFPDFNMPCIEFVRIDESGNLISGVYQFAIQYLDQDLNESRWTTITQPIPIYSDAQSRYDSIKGDHPSQVNPDGTVTTAQTNKSIILNFTNLDESYSFIRVAVIPSTQGLGVAAGAYVVDTISFSGNSIQYTFDSYDENQVTIASLDQITIPRQTFERAKTITQLDNRLILGNVEDARLDHIELTKAALDIQVTYVTRELNADDPGGEYGGESAQSGRYYFDYRSYMRDEIYAFGIVWIFKDGTESPVYHIPGREMDKKADGTPMITVAGTDPNVPHSSGYNASFKAQHNRELPIGTGWDSTVIDQTYNMNTDHYSENPATSEIQRWEVYNTALRTDAPIVGWSYPGIPGVDEQRKLTRGQLAYYECRNSKYPDVRDCNGIPIFPHSGDGSPGNLFVMDNVRHHKMPDTTLEPHFYGNLKGGKSAVGGMGDNLHRWWNSYDHSYIVTLGIEVDNVQIPESIADRVQGYRIVKALANDADKTVIDKGIIFNIHYAFNFYNGITDVDTNIDMCAYAFQGNRFNKQLGEFACAHVPWSGYMKPSKYLENQTSTAWPNSTGRANIAADNYYCFEFNQINEPYGGYVLRHEPSGTVNCFASNKYLRRKQSFMAPLIVNDDWQNWYGEQDLTFDPEAFGIDPLKNPTYAIYPDPDPVHDKMYKGVGYPLGNWGWYKVEGNQGEAEVLAIEDSDGVNIGYETNMYAYPNSSMGYHGPLSKFEKIKSATYVKTERVLIGYSENIICNNACCANDVVRDNNPEVLNGLGELQPGRYDGGSDKPIGGSTYVYTRMSYWQSAVSYTNPSQTFDNGGSVGGANALVGTRMQWQRWSNPCSYQPDTDHYTINPEWATAGVPGSGHRGKSIWENQSARYSKPLQNVRLTDYVKIDPYTEEISFLETILGPGPFFSNHSQQEVLLMGFSWRDFDATTDNRVYWAWPWPGNNYSDTNRGGVPGGVAGYENYTRIPFDHAYSRFNCNYLYDRWENDDDHAAPPDAITGPPEQMDITDPYYDEWYDSDGNPYLKPLNGLGTTYYVSVKKNAYDAYGAIFNLTYTATHNCMVKVEAGDTISEAGELYGGDSFISRFAFKQTQEAAKVSKKVLRSTEENCVGVPNGKPPLIQPLNSSHGPGFDDHYGAAYENLLYTADTRLSFANFNHIVQYWVESYINTELRLGNDADGERIYPYHYEALDAQNGTLSFVDDAALQDSGSPYYVEGELFETFPNYYALNKDYNKAAVESIFSPLPLQFDYCSDCSNKHPHRIAYSEVSIDNEQSDAYRNFLSGNFRDIPGNRGEVWNVWISNNALYIHTEESLWRVDPARQMVNPAEDEAAIYLGTGAFFSSPPREIAQSELGYLGSKSQWATILTETGVIWPDEQQGHIYMQQEGPGDIGNKGMKSWFESNMPISIYKQYKDIYGVDFPLVDNPANPIGAGYTAVFDSEYKRYILTKKDYKLVEDFSDPESIFYKSLEIDPIRNEWVLSESPCNCPDNPQWLAQADPGSYVVTSVTKDGVITCKHTWTTNEGVSSFVEITSCEKTKLTGNDGSIICRTCGDNDFDTPIEISVPGDERTKIINNLNDVFECDSWTVSYSLAPESWTSFHSYMPNYYIGMRHYFYTYMPHLLPIYRHELNGTKTNYQTFYGCTDPFIIDFINNDTALNVNLYDTIRYYTNVSYYDNTAGEYVDDRYITFNRALLYNSYQTTGELSLLVKDENVVTMMETAVNQVDQQSLLKRKDRIWFLNHFRDIARDRTQSIVPSLFTNSWADLQATPYIDKVVNPLAINNAKAWYETQPLKDRYLQVRLFFDNLAGDPASGTYKMTANFILSSSQQSFR